MISPEYWLVCDKVLPEFTAERANGIVGLASDEVRQALCEAIAASADEDNDGRQGSRDVWVLVFKWDPGGSIAFFQSQAMLPEVCDALDCLEYLNDASVQALLMSHIHQFVGRSDSPDFIQELLFAFSRSAKMFPDNLSFLIIFLDFISGYIIQGEPVITNAAQHALEYVIGARGNNFTRGITPMFLEQLCERWMTHLTDFERESMLRVCQSCWRLLGPDFAESTAQATAEPIAATLYTWRDAGRHPPVSGG
jgi:hypothetical protein